MPRTAQVVARAHLLTVADVAARLNVTERWVRDAVYRRTLPFIKVGKLLRFDPDAIERYIEARTDHGAA